MGLMDGMSLGWKDWEDDVSSDGRCDLEHMSFKRGKP